MPTLSVTVSAATSVRIIDSFTKLANGSPPMDGVPPVVVDQKYIENWMKDQLQRVVHQQEAAEAVSELPPPPPIT